MLVQHLLSVLSDSILPLALICDICVSIIVIKASRDEVHCYFRCLSRLQQLGMAVVFIYSFYTTCACWRTNTKTLVMPIQMNKKSMDNQKMNMHAWSVWVLNSEENGSIGHFVYLFCNWVCIVLTGPCILDLRSIDNSTVML